MKPAMFIGTSGWSYKNWDKKFYPVSIQQADKLAHYSEHFNATEVNVSFYKNLEPKTYEHWRELVPADFVFAIKLNRYLTQMKKLKVDQAAQEMLDQFFEGVQKLGHHVAVILIQLPPSLNKDIEKLGTFLNNLPKAYRYAIEFRNKSWFDQETEGLLRENNVGFVISDSPQWEHRITTTANFLYARFHGKEKLFVSQYKEEDLEKWSQTLSRLQNKVDQCYCFFNNTDQGYAIGNAKKLRELLGQP